MANSKFDVDNVVAVKGKPKGMRTFSRKAKGLFVLLALGVIGVIAFAMLSTDEAVSGAGAKDKFAITPAMSKDDLEKLAREKEANDRAKRAAGEKPADNSLASIVKGAAASSLPESKPADRKTEPPPPDPAIEAARRRELERAQLLAEALKADVDAETGRGVDTDSAMTRAMGDLLSASAPSQAGQGLGSVLPQSQQQAAQAGFGAGLQARREAFATQQGQGGRSAQFEKIDQLVPSGDCEVKSGAIIPAVLTRTANSDIPGRLTALVSENVYDSVRGSCMAIPQGSRLDGTYDSDIAVGETRLFVVWQTLTLPDGRAMSLEGMGGSDQAGTAGLTGRVNNHYGKIFGSAVLMSLLSAGVQLSQPREESSADGRSVTSTSQVASGALGQQVGQAGLQVLQRNLSIKPTITIPFGTRFVVDVKRDLVFPSSYR